MVYNVRFAAGRDSYTRGRCGAVDRHTVRSPDLNTLNFTHIILFNYHIDSACIYKLVGAKKESTVLFIYSVSCAEKERRSCRIVKESSSENAFTNSGVFFIGRSFGLWR